MLLPALKGPSSQEYNTFGRSPTLILTAALMDSSPSMTVSHGPSYEH